MCAENPASDPEPVEVVGRSDGTSGARLWGDVPPEERLDWLRVAASHWPFYPGATVGGLTARALSEGHLVNSESLIRIARNAFEAGFTPDEYAELRRAIHGREPDRIVVTRDRRPEHADRYLEIDARLCCGWLDRVRVGYTPEQAADLFLAEERARPATDTPATRDASVDGNHDGAHGSVEFGSGDSSGDGWGIPFGGRGWLRGWWRVFEAYPPRGGVGRTGTGKYARAGEGQAWEAALETIAKGLADVGFTPQDLYILSLTLERLNDDQWARVDKRLFVGEGVHTRADWMLSPIPEKWAKWPRLVHEKGKLPHEATATVLGGVWRDGRRW